MMKISSVIGILFVCMPLSSMTMKPVYINEHTDPDSLVNVAVASIFAAKSGEISTVKSNVEVVHCLKKLPSDKLFALAQSPQEDPILRCLAVHTLSTHNIPKGLYKSTESRAVVRDQLKELSYEQLVDFCWHTLVPCYRKENSTVIFREELHPYRLSGKIMFDAQARVIFLESNEQKVMIYDTHTLKKESIFLHEPAKLVGASTDRKLFLFTQRDFVTDAYKRQVLYDVSSKRLTLGKEVPAKALSALDNSGAILNFVPSPSQQFLDKIAMDERKRWMIRARQPENPGTDKAHVEVVNLSTKALHSCFKEQAYIHDISLDDDRFLLTMGYREALAVSDIETSQVIFSRAPECIGYQGVLNVKNNIFATYLSDWGEKEISLWDLRSAKGMARLPQYCNSCRSFDLSHDSALLLGIVGRHGLQIIDYRKYDKPLLAILDAAEDDGHDMLINYLLPPHEKLADVEG